MRAQAVSVAVAKTAQGWTLLRAGKPYYVKGVAGSGSMAKIVEIGGNSVRTWGPEQAQAVLDDAQSHGLTVMLGLWLMQERQGFDYDNAAAVQRQFETLKPVIDRYKNHPALLIWGIGNELNYHSKNPQAWAAVEQVANYIHAVDPHHPVATVLAGLHEADVQAIKRLAPHVDILAVNAYGEIGSVRRDIDAFGWKGAYLITEWGVNGPWESPKTSWGAALEPTSSDKRQAYHQRYANDIAAHRDRCLGSYAFLWGAKQEYTQTWFGLFTREGAATEPIDALQFAFTGRYPSRPAPTILSLGIDGKAANEEVKLRAGHAYTAHLQARLGQGTTLSASDATPGFVYAWQIVEESADKKLGGDAEQAPAAVPGLIHPGAAAQASFDAPRKPGAYRLFATVTFNDKVAYANIPFWVD